MLDATNAIAIQVEVSPRALYPEISALLFEIIKINEDAIRQVIEQSRNPHFCFLIRTKELSIKDSNHKARQIINAKKIMDREVNSLALAIKFGICSVNMLSQL